MWPEKLVSAIQNNIVTGLNGAVANMSFSLEQIEDAVINERLLLIREYSVKNMIPKQDLSMSIDCIPVDCDDVTGCCDVITDNIQHIELPQIISDFGNDSILYLGSVDRQNQFTVYFGNTYKNHKYKRRGFNKPYVWIKTTPNKNNLFDAYIFNAPSLKRVSVTALFKDPRDLRSYACCNTEEIHNMSFLDKQIEQRVTEHFVRYYRQLAMAQSPNNQMIKP